MNKRMAHSASPTVKRKFPKGCHVKVLKNEIAGQGSSFVGTVGTVMGYCYGDVVLEGDMCFHASELQRITKAAYNKEVA